MENFLKLFPVLEVEEAVNCVHLMLIKKKERRLCPLVGHSYLYI
jgi:hypothetical protein